MNVDSTNGPILAPTMPLGGDPLDEIDYQLVKRWIQLGAKNRDDEERFPPKPKRRKWYVGHYGCDWVTVLDAETRQIMRYIAVGGDPEIREALYDVTVSPDGQHWYASYAVYRTSLDKYSTLTDELVASIPLGHSAWDNLSITQDGSLGFLASYTREEVAVLDLQNDQMVGTPQPLGIETLTPTIHPTLNRIYFPAFTQSLLVIFDYDAQGVLTNRREVDLLQGSPNPFPGELQPLQIAFAPDGNKYFVSCWNSHEIRVYDAANDGLIQVIPLPSGAANMAVSPSTGRLFASCPDDAVTFTGPHELGSIAVVDIASHQLEGMRYAGYQPYGLVADEVERQLLVAARNELTSGPSQHHPSSCQGRNGYLTLLDMQTLTVVSGFNPELSVDPITLSIKY
ncbi:MAG: YncE family protein [Bacteroidia bacterium]